MADNMQSEQCSHCKCPIGNHGGITEDGEFLCRDCVCVKSPTLKHEPDWDTVEVAVDGEAVYLDVTCKYCGASGCIGETNKLAAGISW